MECFELTKAHIAYCVTVLTKETTRTFCLVAKKALWLIADEFKEAAACSECIESPQKDRDIEI